MARSLFPVMGSVIPSAVPVQFSGLSTGVGYYPDQRYDHLATPVSQANGTNPAGDDDSQTNVSPSTLDWDPFAQENWTEIVLPTGQVYHYNHPARISTNVIIHTSSEYKELVKLLRWHREDLAQDPFFRNIADWTDWELCVDIDPFHKSSVKNSRWFYVNYRDRITVGVGEDPTQWDRMKWLEKRAAYWTFLLHYPAHGVSTEEAEKEFVTAIGNGYAERAAYMHERSTFVYPTKTCLALMRAYEFYQKHEPYRGAKVILIARAMYDITNHRIKLKHGTPEALTQFDKDECNTRSGSLKQWLNMLPGVLLLRAHTSYVDRLRDVSKCHIVGDLIYQENVEELRLSMIDEWYGSNILAGILLSSTIAFLAIQDVLSYLPAAVAVLSSISFSLVSLVIGFFLIFAHKSRSDQGKWDQAYRFVTTGRRIGLFDPMVTFGVLLSLPLVALMWSIIAFWAALIAFCVSFFQGGALIFLMTLAGLLLTLVAVVLFLYSQISNAQGPSITARVASLGNGVKRLTRMTTKKEETDEETDLEEGSLRSER